MENIFDKLQDKGWKIRTENGGEVYGGLLKRNPEHKTSIGGGFWDFHVADEEGAKEIMRLIEKDEHDLLALHMVGFDHT